MSTSNGNPPVGSGYGFRHGDRDETAEEREDSQQDAQDRLGQIDRELPGTARNAEERAEQVVVREQGVTDFSRAEEVDRMEHPPSVNDRAREEDGNLISDTVRGAWDALADPDKRDDKTR